MKKLDPKIHEKEISGLAGDPKYIWYGSLAGYDDAPVPLYVENIPMHFAIFGITGSGKSFDNGALMEQLTVIPKGEYVSYPMIVIDAHGDYTDYVDYRSKERLGAAGCIGDPFATPFFQFFVVGLTVRVDPDPHHRSRGCARRPCCVEPPRT